MNTATNQLIQPDGARRYLVYALGQLTSGSLYYTSSLPVITRRVEMVADHLADLLQTSREEYHA